jgi:hypothetical protein
VPTTSYPTTTPSDAPTGVPTFVPSDMPSLVPSDRPSPVPTSESVTFESVHAKTATITVLLDGIGEEMVDFPLAKFEVQTREFVQATMQDVEGFKLQVLAVTVLTQTVVDSDNKVEDNGGRRVLADGEKSLKVSFRVVGVVKSGVAPDDVNYADLFGSGFQNHYTEYLQRISSADPFFDDLIIGSSANDQSLVNDKKKLIATIACSAMAFLVAVFASYYAIKKHLAKRLEEKTLLVLAPSTQSSSSSLGHPKLGEANSLQLQILEPAQDDPMSPMMAALKACMEGDETMSRLQESPMSPNTLEKGSGRRKSKSPFSGGGIEIRKWLTPRRESGARNVFMSEVEPLNSARSGQDPPERSRTSDIPTYNAVPPVDPDARKASTTQAPNRLSNASNHEDTSPQKKVRCFSYPP